MLGDNPEKSKNPLKKAMRRRNAKTVTFTAPTYVEPADYGDYTDEEENLEQELLASQLATNGDTQDTVENTTNEEIEKDETAVVEPLKVNGVSKGAVSENNEQVSPSDDTATEPNEDVNIKPRTSDEILSPPGKYSLFRHLSSCAKSFTPRWLSWKVTQRNCAQYGFIFQG